MPRFYPLKAMPPEIDERHRHGSHSSRVEFFFAIEGEELPEEVKERTHEQLEEQKSRNRFLRAFHTFFFRDDFYVLDFHMDVTSEGCALILRHTESRQIDFVSAAALIARFEARLGMRVHEFVAKTLADFKVYSERLDRFTESVKEDDQLRAKMEAPSAALQALVLQEMQYEERILALQEEFLGRVREAHLALHDGRSREIIEAFFTHHLTSRGFSRRPDVDFEFDEDAWAWYQICRFCNEEE